MRRASSPAAASITPASRVTPLKARIVPANRTRLSNTPERASSEACWARASAAVSEAVNQMKTGSMIVDTRISVPASQLWKKIATTTHIGVITAAMRPGSHCAAWPESSAVRSTSWATRSPAGAPSNSPGPARAAVAARSVRAAATRVWPALSDDLARNQPNTPLRASASPAAAMGRRAPWPSARLAMAVAKARAKPMAANVSASMAITAHRTCPPAPPVQPFSRSAGQRGGSLISVISPIQVGVRRLAHCAPEGRSYSGCK